MEFVTSGFPSGRSESGKSGRNWVTMLGWVVVWTKQLNNLLVCFCQWMSMGFLCQ